MRISFIGIAGIWFESFANKLFNIPFLSKVEDSVLKATLERLNLPHKTILQSQLGLLNRKNSNRYSKEVYFYYYKQGIPSNDFPLQFKASQKNKRLAEFELLINDTVKITGFVNVICGSFFSIQFKEGLPNGKLNKVDILYMKVHHIELN